MEEEDVNRSFSRDDNQTMGMEEDETTSHDHTLDPDPSLENIPPNPTRPSLRVGMEEDESNLHDDTDEQTLDPSRDIPPNPNRPFSRDDKQTMGMEEDESTPLNHSVDVDEEFLDPALGFDIPYLFPQKFHKNESCSECSRVFEELTEFEKRFQQWNQIIDYHGQVHTEVESRIRKLSLSVAWRCGLLLYMYAILKDLKTEIGEEVEPELTKDKSHWIGETVKTEKRIFELLKHAGIPCKEPDEDYEEESDDRFYSIAVVADSGTCYYMDTKLAARADLLIEKIIDKDNEEVDDEVALLKSLIELAKQLPTPLEVEQEIRRLLPHATTLCGRKINCVEFTDIMMEISDVMETTSGKMMKLASGIRKKRHKGDDGGKCTVKDKLESLLKKAKFFEERWNQKYATYFGEFGDLRISKKPQRY